MYKQKLIKTSRLHIYLMSDEEMEKLIHAETNAVLKAAYTEMLDGCKNNPGQREWYALWDIRLQDALEVSAGKLSFKGLTEDGMVEIGYGIAAEYEGCGYAAEAVTALAEWAAAQSGVNRIEAETASDNIASQRVLAKSGFIPTGTIGKEGPRFIKLNY